MNENTAALHRTLTAAIASCDKLEAEMELGGDTAQAMADALKYAEHAAIAARRMCHKIYPAPQTVRTNAMPVPGEISGSEYGMRITLERLLPARGRDAGYIRATLADAFRGRARTFFRDVVVAVEQQYSDELPPRRWRDHDNVELAVLLNELSLWALGGDDPQTMDLFQFATKQAQNATVIHIIPRGRFACWTKNVWGKNWISCSGDFTPLAPPINPASTGASAPAHAPTVGSSVT